MTWEDVLITDLLTVFVCLLPEQTFKQKAQLVLNWDGMTLVWRCYNLTSRDHKVEWNEQDVVRQFHITLAVVQFSYLNESKFLNVNLE